MLLKKDKEMKPGQSEPQPESKPEPQPEPQPEPCPVYQEMQKSVWKPQANGILKAEVYLPGVKANQRQALLDE